MYYDGFHRSFCDDDDDLDIIQESDSIFAFETPETFKLESLRSKRGTVALDLIVNKMCHGARFRWDVYGLALKVLFICAGSLLANLNQNNVKLGNDSPRTPSFMQGAVNPTSPNKNAGADKMILLICNRACIGHQGRRLAQERQRLDFALLHRTIGRYTRGPKVYEVSG